MHLSIIQLPVDFKFQFQQDLKTKKKNKIPIQEKNIKYNTQNSIFFSCLQLFHMIAKKISPKNGYFPSKFKENLSIYLQLP